MVRKDRTNWTRVFAFTVTYILLCAISAFPYTVNSLSGSSELERCLEHPLQTTIPVVAEIARNPLMMFTLAQVMAYSLILGLLTDGYRATKAYVIPKVRQRSAEHA
jgi:hypothetical protein